jgi:hypothetical protein
MIDCHLLHALANILDWNDNHFDYNRWLGCIQVHTCVTLEDSIRFLNIRCFGLLVYLVIFYYIHLLILLYGKIHMFSKKAKHLIF